MLLLNWQGFVVAGTCLMVVVVVVVVILAPPVKAVCARAIAKGMAGPNVRTALVRELVGVVSFGGIANVTSSNESQLAQVQ